MTLTGGKLAGFTEADIWTVGVNDDGSYTFSTADGKKLSMDEKYSSTPLDKAPHRLDTGAGCHRGLLLYQERGPQQLSGVVCRERTTGCLRHHRQQ